MHLPSQRKKNFRKKPRNIPVIKLAMVFFCLLLILAASIFFLKQLNSSFFSRSNRPGIVLATTPILFLSLTPGEDLLVVLIPENTYAQLTRGFGFYQIKASWGLGEIEAKGKKTLESGQLLRETAQEFLGTAVDGWLGPAEGKWEVGQTKEDLEVLRSDLTSVKILGQPPRLTKFLTNLKTNLNLLDLFYLWWNIKNTRFDKINFVNLGQTKASSPLVLADGTSVLVFDQKLLDNALLGLFKDKKIVDEDLTIEILNSTKTDGLGQRAARIIAALGGEVISIGNLERNINQSEIRAPAKLLSGYTVNRLIKIFGAKAILFDSSDVRADVQLILGEDDARMLYQR